MGPPERQKSSWTNAGVGVGLGWTILVELLAIIALFAWVGYRLDRVFGTKPVLFAVLMIVGYAGGVYHVVLYIKRKEADREAGDGR